MPILKEVISVTARLDTQAILVKGVIIYSGVRQLTERLSRNSREPFAEVIAYLRTRTSFQIFRSAHISVSGSRAPFSQGLRVICGFS